MARVYEQRRPDAVVVHDYDDRDVNRSNTGVIIAVVVAIILLLLILLGSRIFGSGGGGSTGPSINVSHPTVNAPAPATKSGY